MPADGGDADALLAPVQRSRARRRGAGRGSSSEGAKSFVDSWNELMDRISEQTSAVA